MNLSSRFLPKLKAVALQAQKCYHRAACKETDARPLQLPLLWLPLTTSRYSHHPDPPSPSDSEWMKNHSGLPHIVNKKSPTKKPSLWATLLTRRQASPTSSTAALPAFRFHVARYFGMVCCHCEMQQLSHKYAPSQNHPTLPISAFPSASGLYLDGNGSVGKGPQRSSGPPAWPLEG